MNKKPAQKIAIVTGGASGIGRAIAEKFIGDKIRTIIIGRDEKKLKSAKKKLGRLCYPVVFDLTNIQGIPALVKNLVEQFGGIDILVNNAGINMKKEFTEVTDDDFQRILQTNLTAVF